MTVTHDVPVVPAPTSPAPSSRRRSWIRRIWGGGRIAETCPAWCTDHHRNDDEGSLDDLTHGTGYVSTKFPVFDADEGTLAMPVLAARIAVDPYSEDPARTVPHVTFEPWQDEVMDCLSPEEFAAVIAQVRAHCDRLDGVLADLVRARADYEGQQAG